MSEVRIAKHSLIRKEKLDPYQYTVSLLREGFRAGLFDKHFIYRIQEQIMLILKNLIVSYTKGESSSVRTETAESLLNSIYYSIDAYLGSLPDPETGIEVLKPEKVREVYEKGIEAVNECLKETLLLCRWVLKHKLDVPLEVYKSSVEEAIPEFFELYNVVFGAHDTTCSLDYPLVFDDMNVRGVYYMKNYLQNLKTETTFCMLFPEKDIRRLLEVYGRTCRIEYKEVPFNLFEIVINNSIFSVLSGNSAGNLKIHKPQYQILYESLSSMDASELRDALDKAVETIFEELDIKQHELIEYIRRYAEVLTPRLLNAVSNNSLQNMVMVEQEQNYRIDRLILESNRRMSDKAFKVLVSKIGQCKDTQGKVELIKSEVCSIADFADVLGADCLFREDYSILYASLSDMELALLGKMLFFDGYGEGVEDFQRAFEDGEEAALEWQQQYIRFISEMNKDRIKAVQEIFKGL